MTSELPLPAELKALVASYAVLSPTPSAAAIQAYFDESPWIEDMVTAYPMIHPGIVIMGAPYLGLFDCSKCSHCLFACTYQIRRRYEPDESPEV